MAPVNIFKHGADEEKAETARLVGSFDFQPRLMLCSASEGPGQTFPLLSAVLFCGSHCYWRSGEEHSGTEGNGESVLLIFGLYQSMASAVGSADTIKDKRLLS